MHYLVIRVDTKETAETLANDILKRYFGFNFTRGTGEDVYYNASNVCEDISQVTLLLTKDEDEEE